MYVGSNDDTPFLVLKTTTTPPPPPITFLIIPPPLSLMVFDYSASKCILVMITFYIFCTYILFIDFVFLLVGIGRRVATIHLPCICAYQRNRGGSVSCTTLSAYYLHSSTTFC
eukprot:m.39506 g.39506  ORF g.39506 m.39506 type:complete len:113 (-) comp6869_c1_seq2:292-630(-)